MRPETVVAFAERLAQIAAAGGGATEIAGCLSETTGTAVLVEDSQWRRIARAGAGVMPGSARETVESGAAGRALRIASGNAHVGWLSAFDNGVTDAHALADADLELLMRVAAAALAAELSRHPDAPRERRNAFWRRLLERQHRDPDAARDDAAGSDVTLAGAYLTVALERETNDGRAGGDLAELRAVARDTFRSEDAGVGMLECGATLLIFLPAAREVDASNARTAATLLPKTVAKRAKPLQLCGGVGTVEPPIELHRSADAAQTALSIGRRLLGDGRVTSYDDLGAYPLLYEGADLRRLQTFARSVLAPLRAYDEKHQTELERTLRLFFETGQNVKTAAARLNVHRHTVFYRLRQIGEICACTLESPHDQLTLRLAVAIDALHSS